MAITNSPRIVTNGLVMYYDMSNTQKSWRGYPTTNQFTLPTAAVNGFGVQSSTFTRVYTGNFGGYEIKPTDYVWQYNISGGDCPYHGWDIPTTAGTVVTFSFDYYVSPTTVGYPSTNYLANIENVGIGASASTGDPTPATIGVWKRAYLNVTATTTGNARCLMYPGGCGGTLASGTGFILYRNPQVEFNSPGNLPSPFVAGSRSTSGAILDLTGNNTITTTSLTYAADNTFSFNGTTNELHPTINHSYLSSSALEVIFRSTSHGSGYKTIFGYSHNNGYSRPTIGSLYLENNTLSASVITASQVYRTATVAENINTNTYYHVVLNKNTTTGVLDIYVNGVLSGTQTFDAATYGQWTVAGSFIGSNLLDIGKSTNTNSAQGWSTDFFNGVIPIARVYNRVLSAGEVTQNFNALRGRYSNPVYTFNVGNIGSSFYTFTGQVTGNNPNIAVASGSTLVFNVNAPGHPFWIKTTPTTGASGGVTVGSTTNQGASNGTVTWDTSGVPAGTYYYICQFHSGMVGTINIG
jgi:hypothetical protein